MNLGEPTISIAVDKFSNHFSAAHALITDQFAEGLHGHNYLVEVEIEGIVDSNDLLIDFIYLDELLKQIIAKWDHYVLMPSNNQLMKIKKNDSNFEIEYGNRFYSIPKEEIRFLECTNVTTESLARLLGEEIYQSLTKEANSEKIQSIKLTVWETHHYRASCTIYPNSLGKNEK